MTPHRDHDSRDHDPQGRLRGHGGFSLPELMVVVLIMAILVAIAIPSFLGARESAEDRSAQHTLRNALTAAKTVFADENSYDAAAAADLSEVEPQLIFVGASVASTQPDEVSVDGDGDEWVAAAWSESEECFYIRSLEDTQGSESAGIYYANGTSPGSCQANASGLSWIREAW